MLRLVGWSWDFYGQFWIKSLVNDGSSGSIICGRPEPLRCLIDLCSQHTYAPKNFTLNQKVTYLKKKIIGVNCIKFSLLQPKTQLLTFILTILTRTSSQDTWCHIIVDNLGRTHHYTLILWQELLTPTTPPQKKKKNQPVESFLQTNKQNKQKIAGFPDQFHTLDVQAACLEKDFRSSGVLFHGCPKLLVDGWEIPRLTTWLDVFETRTVNSGIINYLRTGDSQISNEPSTVWLSGFGHSLHSQLVAACSS